MVLIGYIHDKFSTGLKSKRMNAHTVSSRAPRRSPKVISTMVESGSESKSIITLGVGTESVSFDFPSC